jgi:hypothetical protein
VQAAAVRCGRPRLRAQHGDPKDWSPPWMQWTMMGRFSGYANTRSARAICRIDCSACHTEELGSLSRCISHSTTRPGNLSPSSIETPAHHVQHHLVQLEVAQLGGVRHRWRHDLLRRLALQQTSIQPSRSTPNRLGQDGCTWWRLGLLPQRMHAVAQPQNRCTPSVALQWWPAGCARACPRRSGASSGWAAGQLHGKSQHQTSGVDRLSGA